METVDEDGLDECSNECSREWMMEERSDEHLFCRMDRS